MAGLGRGLDALLSASSKKVNQERGENNGQLGTDLIRRSLAAKQGVPEPASTKQTLPQEPAYLEQNEENIALNVVNVATVSEKTQENQLNQATQLIKSDSANSSKDLLDNTETTTSQTDSSSEAIAPSMSVSLTLSSTTAEAPQKNHKTVVIEKANKDTLNSDSLPPIKVAEEHIVHNILLSNLQPSTYQPRQYFDEASLQELADSIKEHGLLEPLLVKRTTSNNYEIICGERRYKAAKLANLKFVPCLIRDVNDTKGYAIALIENIQREDLNALEQAYAFDQMMKECNLTQDELAQNLGKSRSAIANILRLLKLEEFVKDALRQGQIDVGHAKVLLALKDDVQVKTCKVVIDKALSVRATELFVKKLQSNEEIANHSKEQDVVASTLHSFRFTSYEDSLNSILNGVKAKFSVTQENKGKLTLSYSSEEELNSLLDLLGLPHQVDEPQNTNVIEETKITQEHTLEDKANTLSE